MHKKHTSDSALLACNQQALFPYQTANLDVSEMCMCMCCAPADGVGQQSELASNSLHAHQEKARLLAAAGSTWTSSDALVSAFIHIPKLKDAAASSSNAASPPPRYNGPFMVFADNACGIPAKHIHRSAVQYEEPPGHEELDKPVEYPCFGSGRTNYFGPGGWC
jgi:hypothetical protein